MSGATYRISDVTLSSDIALPELPEVVEPADWSFVVARRKLISSRPAWFHYWRTPGETRSLSFARHEGGYLLRFHGRADFAIDLARRSIVGWRRPPATLTTLRHMLLDQIMPLVLSRDRLVLHASAVVTPSGAAAFVGFTGSGKSTLGAALATAGFPLLTDDCLVIERSRRGFLARPLYLGARLWPDSIRAVGARRGRSGPLGDHTRKRRLDATRLACRSEAMPLRRLFILERPDQRSPRADLVLTRARGAEAYPGSAIAPAFAASLDLRGRRRHDPTERPAHTGRASRARHPAEYCRALSARKSRACPCREASRPRRDYSVDRSTK